MMAKSTNSLSIRDRTFPEAVQLGFWSVDGRDLERMSAAYGPYGLTRLCAETGGVYFIADESRVHRFDPEMMRNYLPYYRSKPTNGT